MWPFKPKKPMTVDEIKARIKYVDELPHADIYSRWEADKEIIQLNAQLNGLNQ